MSSKKKELDPRIAVKETIITRTKSAQLGRQLREKDRSMKSITQLLMRSPPSKTSKNLKSCGAKKKKNVSKIETETKVPEKLFSLPKTPERKITHVVENKEYYPNMLKRAVKVKKVVLKPKDELKMIGDTKSVNKRKLQIPRKDMESPPYKRTKAETYQNEMDLEHHTSELTMERVLRLTEDTESLTDEDLLEILTCPSPVWWEDSPGPGYFEDPIFTRSPTDEDHKRNSPPETLKLGKISSPTTAETVSENSVLEISLEKKTDKKFMTKRTKLESLLGSLKSKIANSSHVSDNVIHDSDKRLTSVHICDAKEFKIKKSDPVMKIDTDEFKMVQESFNKKPKSPLISPKTKRYSESTEENLSDISLMDDYMLQSLENTEIPIENELYLNAKHINLDSREVNQSTDEHSDKQILNKLINSGQSTDNITIDSCREILEKIQDVGTSPSCSEKSFRGFANDISKENNSFEDILQITLTEQDDLRNKNPLTENKGKGIEIVLPDVPTTLPSLKRFPKTIEKELLSPMSEETIDASSQMSDTISDTNIRFITDEEVFSISNNTNCVKHEDALKDPNDQQHRNHGKTIEMKSTEAEESKTDNKTEYITVYQIISNDANDSNENRDFFGKNTVQVSLSKTPSTESSAKTCNLDKSHSNNKNKLNNFYKNCKTYSVKQSKLKNTSELCQAKLSTDDTKKYMDSRKEKANENATVCKSCDKDAVKAIVVSGKSKVKYCKKCSSIFDTEICMYCVNNFEESCTPTSESCRKMFICDFCSFRAKNKNNLQVHLLKHFSDNKDAGLTDLSKSELGNVGKKEETQ